MINLIKMSGRDLWTYAVDGWDKVYAILQYNLQ